MSIKSSNADNEQLFPFGPNAGDSGVFTLSQEITLNTPFIFYGVEETTLHVRELNTHYVSKGLNHARYMFMSKGLNYLVMNNIMM